MSQTTGTQDGFTAEERAAMKERAAELRAEGTKGAKKADGLQAVLDSIAKMAPVASILERNASPQYQTTSWPARRWVNDASMVPNVHVVSPARASPLSVATSRIAWANFGRSGSLSASRSLPRACSRPSSPTTR